jgi:NAD(P)-dependent dehydrogenase (short-subunit alcohol dehydrogenase family)
MAIKPQELLRDGLLTGAAVVVAGAEDSRADSAGGAVAESAAALGAQVSTLALAGGEEAAAEAESRLAEIVSARGPTPLPPAIVIDTGGCFDAGGGREALVGSLAASWNAARAAGLAFISAEGGGRIVAIGPAAGSEHALAAVASLENLARTLSIEWARYGITTVAVAPAAATSREELAVLACWLLSPAGAYFSGCLLDLRGPDGA